MARHRLPDSVTIRCSIEGPACIKMDGDGAGQIKLTFPHTEGAEVQQLMSQYRECQLLVTFLKAH